MIKKGVILCGGLGKRLFPLTKVTNKHLLPIYDRPMVFIPIMKMVEAGIKEIMLVTGGQYAGDFLRIIGNGKFLGIKKLHYTYQEGEKGIADALSLAEDFADNKPLLVILGDNIFEDSLLNYINTYKDGAMLFLKEVKDANRFGVAFIKDKKITKIVEKPRTPETNLAVTGIYIYDSQVFDFIKKLSPSERGELEITDVNNMYININKMSYRILKGWWTDAGTISSYNKAIKLFKQKVQNEE